MRKTFYTLKPDLFTYIYGEIFTYIYGEINNAYN